MKLVCDGGIVLSHKIVVASASHFIKNLLKDIPVGDSLDKNFDSFDSLDKNFDLEDKNMKLFKALEIVHGRKSSFRD